MKGTLVALFAGVLLLGGCSTADGMDVSDAKARPAMQDGNGAVYLTIQNLSTESDELTGVSSDIAQAVEMHESRMEGDVMQMRQVMSLPIKGRDSIQFKPGGYHVMLIGLKQDLMVGDEIQVTLHFKNHADIPLTVPVQETTMH